MKSPDEIVVAQVAGVFGLRGEVKLVAADADALRPGLAVSLALSAGRRNSSVLEEIRPHKRMFVARLRGVDSEAAARALAGASVLAARADVPRLPEDVYRAGDLVGMRVVDARRGLLGEVTEIRHYPSCDMLVVGKGKLLVPALRAYSLAVDVAAREIRVALPEGFEELI